MKLKWKNKLKAHEETERLRQIDEEKEKLASVQKEVERKIAERKEAQALKAKALIEEPGKTSPMEVRKTSEEKSSQGS